MKDIIEVGKDLDLTLDQLDVYGKFKAKINLEPNVNKNSNLVLVTAINPTPYGEGKTTVSIGLDDALCKIGERSVVVLREPSLGPVFGMKGGATGGGKASIVPNEDINLHFTGDFHAITAANNLLSAAIYNHIYHGNELGIDKENICFKRCLDVNDRELRKDFNITAASEIMAVFCLTNDFNDLVDRLGNILIGYNLDGNGLFARDLNVHNAMATLLKDAFKPNLVQTLEGNPAIVHGGPFANIAHGCNSIVATKTGLTLADYVITEAGFGSDLGAEKFIDIKCRAAGLYPNFIILVATVKALKHSGMINLDAHFDHLKQYQVPFCVALNKFFDDNEEDLTQIRKYCDERGVQCIVVDSFNAGSLGSLELADYVIEKCSVKNDEKYLYDIDLDIREKIETLASKVYHANNIDYAVGVLEKIEKIEKYKYPICIAKTPYSISDDKDKLGYPKDYTLHVRDVVLQTGSKMIIVLLNNVITMPGLPKKPNFENF